MSLSDAATRVLEAAIELQNVEGRPPTQRAIASRLRRATRAVAVQLETLERHGYVERGEGARNLRILRDASGKPFGSAAQEAAASPRTSKPTPLPAAQRENLFALMRAYEAAAEPVTALAVGRQLGGLDPRAAEKRLSALVEAGYVGRENNRFRVLLRADGTPYPAPQPRRQPSGSSKSLEPVTAASDPTELLEHALRMLQHEPTTTVRLPVLGRIAAGKPIEVVPQHADTIDVPAAWVRGDSFVLRVAGDSMIDDAILDGDFVVVRRQEVVEDGETAVALLPDGTATLKRIYRDKQGVRLQPANENYPPIIVPEVQIQGLVVAVLRLP